MDNQKEEILQKIEEAELELKQNREKADNEFKNADNKIVQAKKDIENNEMYVLEDEDGIQASFVFYCGIDPCYNKIYDGQWLNDEPYGVIHRIATRGLKKHMADIILEYCESKIDNIRMDTHMDNKPMQNFMLKHGFKHVGTIYLKNGQSRLAFHCNLNKN